MAIRYLEARNFKSFDRVDIRLDRFNVLIGANASGKSNFIQILRFLRDTAALGLRNAISLQGDAYYLCNAQRGPSDAVSIRLHADLDPKGEEPLLLGTGQRSEVMFRFSSVEYELAITFVGRQPDPRIALDKLTFHGEVVQIAHRRSGNTKRSAQVMASVKGDRTPGTLEISRTASGYRLVAPSLPGPEKNSKGQTLSTADFIRDLLNRTLSHHEDDLTTILERTSFLPWFPSLNRVLNGVAIYDIDAELLKNASAVTGKSDLEEDGSNLAIVLKNILDSDTKSRSFSDLVGYILPFVHSFDVDRVADRLLIFKLREKYAPSFALPAPLMSDGTVNIVALVIALYFEHKQIIVLEEPERNIHPFLIERVVEMMRDSAERHQIIVTTHNTEVVRSAGIDNLLLVSRDSNGFSTITRPADRASVQEFLQAELGIDYLYSQDLLGA